MRALQLLSYGVQPEITDVSTPAPKSGEVLLKIDACGLNFGDLLLIKGTYQEKPDLPFTLGMEVAGTITALGEDVKNLAVGTRVAVFGGTGGLADYGCFEAQRCVPIPDQMTSIDAAAFLVGYGTSHLALTHRAKVGSGDTVLVTGAAGGVGLTAVEISAHLGATVIAVARGADKLKIAGDAGAKHLIDADDPDLTQKLKDLGGLDVIYDAVGGALFTASLKACNRGARVLVIGFASGDVPPIPANILLVKNITVHGFYWGGYLKLDPKPLVESLAESMDWYVQGKIAPHVSQTYPLEEANAGFEALRLRKSTGKVVITL
ncbi:MAG: NADPH:quinone oxidoreductase family protein [Pseudomonadota bacterium]